MRLGLCVWYTLFNIYCCISHNLHVGFRSGVVKLSVFESLDQGLDVAPEAAHNSVLPLVGKVDAITRIQAINLTFTTSDH